MIRRAQRTEGGRWWHRQHWRTAAGRGRNALVVLSTVLVFGLYPAAAQAAPVASAPATSAPATSAPATPAAADLPTVSDLETLYAAPSCARVSFQVPWTSKYVSAEFGAPGAFYGMLRARAERVGPWELFILCNHGGWFTIQADLTDQYVRVEEDYEGRYEWMLRAAGNSLSNASAFYRITGSVAWSVFQYSATGDYVSAELTYPGSDNGMLRARADVYGDWEKFIVAIR